MRVPRRTRWYAVRVRCIKGCTLRARVHALTVTCTISLQSPTGKSSSSQRARYWRIAAWPGGSQSPPAPFGFLEPFHFHFELVVSPFQEACEGDTNGDGTVDPLDSGFVLSRFGCLVGTCNPQCDAADANGDLYVDPLDVGFVLARLGPCE